MKRSNDAPASAPLVPAANGSGPLLQRDYWAVIRGCRGSARDVAHSVAVFFERFAPPEMVTFRRAGGAGDAEHAEGPAPEPCALRIGDEMEVDIRVAGSFGVRVVHRDALSLTIGTLEGHPEAGRITFGAYPSADGEVVFHIRSRARSGSAHRYLGFLTAGEPMQTLTWTGFVQRVAVTVGEGVRDVVHAETREVEEEPADRADQHLEPTFRAVDEECPG